MRTLNGKINFTSKKEEWVMFNPYEIIGNNPKEFTAKELIQDEVIKLDNGYIKVVDFGAYALFGKDSYSFMWVLVKEVDENSKNPNRYFYSIRTHNPSKIYHKTLQNPEGSKYGGVNFGGWCNNVEDCIQNYFPKKYTEKGTDSLYYSKTLKITHIKQIDLETGEIFNIEINDSYNTLLNSL